MGQKVLLFYIYAMTILTFSICGADKFAAQRQRRRVPEKVLFLLSALGGSVGMYLGCSPSVTRPSTGILWSASHSSSWFRRQFYFTFWDKFFAAGGRHLYRCRPPAVFLF